MTARWYVIHVYSGFENKVAQSIREQAVQKHLDDMFDEVLVPTEEVVRMRRGAKVRADRKFFPGYVLIKMELTDETWHLVKDTPKVTGFLGGGGHGKPSPISEAETQRIRRQVQEGVERPSRRSPSMSASRSGSATGPSPPSTGPWRRSTRNAPGSR